MEVQCDQCGKVYDDTYRLTYCPHVEFQMNCLVARGGKQKLCHTIEEVQGFLALNRPKVDEGGQDATS